MSIEEDISSLEKVPTFRLLGIDSIRVLAIGSETRNIARGETLFRTGDTADAGYVVQHGALRITADEGSKHEMVAGPGTLVGELALIVAMKRPATATALEDSVTIRISRSLFQKVLEADPAAARRLRDHLAERTGDAASAIMSAGLRLS
jgi:CRP-like cAMP-binding protein